MFIVYLLIWAYMSKIFNIANKPRIEKEKMVRENQNQTSKYLTLSLSVSLNAFKASKYLKFYENYVANF